LIGLYNQLSETVIEDFPLVQPNNLKTQADADYNRFEEILKFSPKQENVYNAHNKAVERDRAI